MHHVTIFGAGYVGLVSGACLADAGNHVLCIDVDEDRIAHLERGEIPIHEPGLERIVRNAAAAGRLRFSTDLAAGVAHGLFLFIAVGTPPEEDGSADLGHVLSVARSIGEHIDEYRIVVNKSTVPVGTADRVQAEIAAALERRGVACDFNVVSNPEFLKEGAAVEDFMKPARIIVGADNPRTAELLRALYQPFNRNRDRVLVMDVRSAELTKYAANAMLATKISFMNEMAGLAELVGADIEQVRVGIGLDPRIGHAFIYPGAGFGGSCFPKDVRALSASAAAHGHRLELIAAVERVNERQQRLLFEKILHYFGGELRGRTIALWGLAFKPNTDDMREASSRVLMEALWDAGATVRAYDPVAMDEARRLYPNRVDLELHERRARGLAPSSGDIHSNRADLQLRERPARVPASPSGGVPSNRAELELRERRARGLASPSGGVHANRAELELCERAELALEGADALAIVTEWREFNSPDFDLIKATLRNPVIFDGRNMYDPGDLERRGIRYFGIGRGESVEPSARSKFT